MMNPLSMSVLIPSLEHFAIICLVQEIWKKQDILVLISNFVKEMSKMSECQRLLTLKFDRKGTFNSPKWKFIEDIVIKTGHNVTGPIPESLRCKITSVTRAMGHQIIDWIRLLQTMTIRLPVVMALERICWTPVGAIDKIKTAKKIIEDHSMCLTSRYEIAHGFYFLDDAYILRKELEKQRTIDGNDFSIRKYFYKFGSVFSHYRLVSEQMIEGTCPLVLELREEAFAAAVASGNIVAIRYFWDRSDLERRKELMFSMARAIYLGNREFPCSDVVLFLLSVMPEWKLEFQSRAADILLCLIEWPYQDYFIKCAECVKCYLSESGYYDVLIAVCIKSQENCYFEEAFISFCHQKPSNFRLHSVRKILSKMCLSKKIEENDRNKCLSHIQSHIK